MQASFARLRNMTCSANVLAWAVMREYGMATEMSRQLAPLQ
jgi:hypothetical protein